MRRKYGFALLAGLGMFAAVYVIDRTLARFGLPAEATYIDDLLLGVLTCGLVFFLQQRHERELRKHLECEAVVRQLNHHIRNALQVIVCRASLDSRDQVDLEPMQKAVERIDWALREILPITMGNPKQEATPEGKFPVSRSVPLEDISAGLPPRSVEAGSSLPNRRAG